jgi:hypothetical protein
MKPDNSPEKQPNINLPMPVAPEAPKPKMEPILQQGSERNPEFLPVLPSSTSPTQGSQLGRVPQAMPQALPGAVTPATQSASSISASVNPAIADDVDLIEKEWVEKAKAIVSQTKEDPYKQNKEISKMKADYIKKRYNKDVHLSES